MYTALQPCILWTLECRVVSLSVQYRHEFGWPGIQYNASQSRKHLVFFEYINSLNFKRVFLKTWFSQIFSTPGARPDGNFFLWGGILTPNFAYRSGIVYHRAFVYLDLNILRKNSFFKWKIAKTQNFGQICTFLGDTTPDKKNLLKFIFSFTKFKIHKSPMRKYV